MTGGHIRAVLSLAGVSRAEAAEALGVTEGTFSNKLTNDRFTVQELRQLAELCGAYIRITGAGWSLDIAKQDE